MKSRIQTLVLVLLLLLRSIQPWNPDFVYDTLLRISVSFANEQFLMFYCAECRDERMDRIVARLHRGRNLPQYVTNDLVPYKFQRIAKRNYLAIIFTHSFNDTIIEIYDKSMRNWHFYLGVIVMLTPVDDMQVIEQFLRYLYRKRFTNTHLYFACSNASDRMFSFRMYPDFDLSNETDWEFTIKDLGQSFLAGARGKVFKTPIRADVPRVFKFKNHAGRTEIQGTSYRILLTFFNYERGKIADFPQPNSSSTVNMKEVIQLLKNEDIEISPHAYELYHKGDIDQSYPLLVVQWCIMVPSFNKITGYLYPIKPFDWKVWALYFGSILSFTVTVYCYEKFTLEKIDFGGQVLVSVSLMLNITAPKTFKNPSVWEFFFFTVILLHTGVVTYFYASFLGSILTVNLFRQQINTMEELIAANLPVMMIDYEYEFLRSIIPLLPEFESLILPVDTDTLSHHRNSMNTSYAYVTTDDRWHFIALQQKYLKQPKFRLSDICFGSFHMGFPMEIEMPLWRDLQYFIFRLHSSGLYQYFESTAFDFAVQGGYMQRFTAMDEFQAAGMEHLMLPFHLLLGLLALSCVVFAGEIVWKKYKK